MDNTGNEKACNVDSTAKINQILLHLYFSTNNNKVHAKTIIYKTSKSHFTLKGQQTFSLTSTIKFHLIVRHDR